MGAFLEPALSAPMASEDASAFTASCGLLSTSPFAVLKKDELD
jgi:hypothetical protein